MNLSRFAQAAIAVCGLLTFIFLAWYGSFGGRTLVDKFAAILGDLSAGAALLLVWYGLHLQRKELTLQRNELTLQREEVARLADETSKASALQAETLKREIAKDSPALQLIPESSPGHLYITLSNAGAQVVNVFVSCTTSDSANQQFHNQMALPMGAQTPRILVPETHREAKHIIVDVNFMRCDKEWGTQFWLITRIPDGTHGSIEIPERERIVWMQAWGDAKRKALANPEPDR